MNVSAIVLSLKQIQLMLPSDQQFPAGIYIVFSNDESIADTILNDISSYQMLNLARHDALKVPIYFKKEKLQWIAGIITSQSEHPNKLFSCIIHLLQKMNCLIIGSAGLSHDSTIEIIEYFTKNIPSGKSLFFIDSVTRQFAEDLKFIHVTTHTMGELEATLKDPRFKSPAPKITFTPYLPAL